MAHYINQIKEDEMTVKAIMRGVVTLAFIAFGLMLITA
jgi:hypothetical protein